MFITKKTAKQEGYVQKEVTKNLVIFQKDLGKKEMKNEKGKLIVSTCNKILFPRNAEEDEEFWFKRTKKEFKKKFKENDRLFIENRFSIDFGGKIQKE